MTAVQNALEKQYQEAGDTLNSFAGDRSGNEASQLLEDYYAAVEEYNAYIESLKTIARYQVRTNSPEVEKIICTRDTYAQAEKFCESTNKIAGFDFLIIVEVEEKISFGL